MQPDLIESMNAISKDPFFMKAALWAQIVGFISGVLLSFYVFERKKGWKLGFGSRGFLRKGGEGLAWGAGLITLSGICIWLFGGILIVETHWSSSTAYEIGAGLLLFIGVALNEELFARGYLQGLLKHQYGVKTAVTVSTLIFAFLHSFNPGMWSSPIPFINLVLAGLLLGLSREFTDSLWMPVGLHFAWNFMQGCVFGFDVSGIEMSSLIKTTTQGADLISGGRFGAEGSVVTSFILVLGLIMIYNYYQTRSAIQRMGRAPAGHEGGHNHESI
ncbi:CPBP family intramembrane glutamic endopeptidase [Paenibacillus roseipurpureus]|uniref:CPBP family intramembrane metalloprotease n=1 Tax=Paenibacillus roseopurpureus TaxID=2918901 RepID=A0AA96LIU0_9BACL|nr:CPBP family intramembrane glutamic endopeptidase [Paenibacillus sp. MBLB1832]WNR42587.1 CPBP family intramembrane metalloprotease [Paenibacillus sp. MBLB1832]